MMTMTAPTTDCTMLPTVPDNEMPSFGNSQEPRSPPRIPKIAFPIRPDPPSPTRAPAIPPIRALTSKEMTNCIISIIRIPFPGIIVPYIKYVGYLQRINKETQDQAVTE